MENTIKKINILILTILGFMSCVSVAFALDTTAPVITLTCDESYLGVCPDPITVEVGEIYTAAEDGSATAMDDVDGDISGDIVTTGLPVDTSVAGTFYVVYSVSDAAGNPASTTRTVNVVAHTTGPVITIIGSNPLEVAQSLDSTYDDPGATAYDVVDGNVTSNIIVTGTSTVDTKTVGTYIITYTVTDSALNTTIETRTVNVTDSFIPAPVITILGSNPTSIIVGESYTDAGATALDNDGTTISVTATGTVNVDVAGTYTITYTATDAVLNVSTSTRTVYVNNPSHRRKVITPVEIVTETPITTLVSTTTTEISTTTTSEEITSNPIIPEVTEPEITPEIVTETIVKIPNKIVKQNSTNNNGEVLANSTTSNASTTENNTDVATVFEAFAGIPQGPIAVVSIISLLTAAGLMIYKKFI